MARIFQGQPTPLIRDLFRGALASIMAEHNIEPLQQSPSHMVSANADFREVVQHTEWYSWGGDSRPPYRYRRYRELLEHLLPRPDCRQISHVDLGCGAGLFSWALLDWARQHNIPFNNVTLYGLDHNPQMVNLALSIRSELMLHVNDYPELHYTHHVIPLFEELELRHVAATGYIVTFGHVLVQANIPSAMLGFTQVIDHMFGLLDDQSNCVVMAADAQGWSSAFASSWDALMTKLTELDIGHQEMTVTQSYINDGNRARIAWLSPIGDQEN